MSDAVQWNRFRGALKRVLDANVTDELSPKTLSERSGGIVRPDVLQSFLRGERDSMPEPYLDALCADETLGLGPEDYRITELTPLPNKSERHVPEAIEENRRIISKRWNRRKVSEQTMRENDGYSPIAYSILNAPDGGESLRNAFSDRLWRAGVKRADIGRQFFSTVGRSKLSPGINLYNFYSPAQNHEEGPQFPHRLQENFWSICEHLNSRIHQNADQRPTTRQFVLDLLQEGNVQNAETIADRLEVLHNHVSKSRLGSPGALK